jgi:hypothetical protein
MKKLLFTALMLVAQICVSQNLVNNWSFEDTVQCPHNANQINRAAGWHSSRNSPDYFNGCDWVNGTSWVPNNFVGYQYANTGEAYCGFIPYDKIGFNYRESFTSQLLAPLIVGKKYNVSFYMSWAGTISSMGTGVIGCNKIGIHFSTMDFDTVNNAPLQVPLNTQFYTDSIIIDSLNWVKIYGDFTADSNYSYISIGRFTPDSLMDTIHTPPASTVYYFIDDINVSEDSTTGMDELINEDFTSVFPNPCFDLFVIQSKKQLITQAEIFSVTSTSILSYQTPHGLKQIELNLTNIPDGIYFLRLDFENKKTVYYKLLKL